MTPFVFLLTLLWAANIVPSVAPRMATHLENGNHSVKVREEAKGLQQTAEGLEEADVKRVVRNVRSVEKVNLCFAYSKSLRGEISDVKSQLESARKEIGELKQSQRRTETVSTSQTTPASTDPTEEPTAPTVLADISRVAIAKQPQATSLEPPTDEGNACSKFIKEIECGDLPIANLEISIIALEQAKTEVDNDLKLATAKVEKLENELDELKRGCPKDAQNGQSPEHLEKIRVLEEQHSDNIKLYDDQLKSLNASNSEYSKKLETASEQHKECKKHAMELDAAAIVENQAMTAKVKDLEEEIEDLKKGKENFEVAAREHETKYRLLEKKVNNIAQKNDGVREKMNLKQESDSDIEVLRSGISTLEKAKSDIVEDLKLANATLDEKRQKVDQLAELKNGCPQNHENPQRTDMIPRTEHLEKVRDLQDRLGFDIKLCKDQLTSLKAARDDDIKKLGTTLAEHAVLNKTILELQTTGARFNQSMTEKVKELEAMNEDMKGEKTKHDAAVSELETKYKLLETNAMQEHIDMVDKMEKMKNETAVCKSDLRRRYTVCSELKKGYDKCKHNLKCVC